MQNLETTAPAGHLPWLDGLRGTAAVWVLVAHVLILTGLGHVPVLNWGGVAVDLFMMLSGFLMTHHYLLRQAQEPWDRPSTWTSFWTRRTFRIAPLYYVLLAAALLMGPWLGEARDAIAAVWPETATSPARYLDRGADNVLAHVSFVFGVLPHYAFRTPLPDWSIGLEMQFYLVFPLLMLWLRRFGAIVGGLVLVAACLAARKAFPDFFWAFEMPAFLPLKLYVFLAGMWIALGRARRSLRGGLVAAVAVGAAMALHERSAEAVGRVVVIAALFWLMNDGSLPTPRPLARAVSAVRLAFSGPVSRFLGDTSYGLYLVHLLVLLPVAGLLARQPDYVATSGVVRAALCLLVVLPVSLLLAWGLHRTVEQPGIRWGKAVLARWRAGRPRAADARA